MSLLPPAEPTFWQKHLRKILVSGLLASWGRFLFVLASQAHARAGSLERLADIHASRNALALYFHSRNDYPPSGEATSDRAFGVGDAVCLDRSDEGLRASCENGVITAMLPRGVFYSKSGAGEYLLTFTLRKSVGDLGDTDRNGIIDCEASAIGMVCR